MHLFGSVEVEVVHKESAVAVVEEARHKDLVEVGLLDFEFAEVVEALHTDLVVVLETESVVAVVVVHTV